CMNDLCVPTCTLESHCTGLSSLLTCVESEGICVYACVSGACPTGYSCLTSENACLPTGSFPGSPCKAGDLCDNVNGIPQACVDSGGGKVCVATCANEGQCQAVNAVLTCVEAQGLCFPACSLTGNCNPAAIGAGFSCFTTYDACLPTGTFPGSPCTADAQCLPVGGAPQTCVGEAAGAGQCSVQCAPGSSGDALCEAVSLGLKCMPMTESPAGGICNYACIAGECDHLGAGYTCMEAYEVCLATGTFPSSPCLPVDGTHSSPWCRPVGGAGPVTQSCVNSMCVVNCDEAVPQTGDALCAAVNSALTCMPQSGTVGLCVYACVSGACLSGYACYDQGTPPTNQNACLPVGSFPFGPCKLNGTCDNYGTLPMACQGGKCVVSCTDGGGGDAICPAVNSALTCEDYFAHVCLPACVSGSCAFLGGGYTCAPTGQNACLPTGSYPTGPCRASSPRCDSAVGGVATHNLVCANPGTGEACYFDCSWNPTVCADFTGMGTCYDLGNGSICGPP
ncbi:MAG: hypothetical protein HY906_13835, partial [Deltaproteobacteria bacterium]|nr:hypothetical protein [Deltaproteobacteria bacterium]